MKKYLVLSFLILSACGPKPQAKHFVCFNPFSPMQSVQISTDSPGVKETHSTLSVPANEGLIVVVQKSTCVEILEAK